MILLSDEEMGSIRRGLSFRGGDDLTELLPAIRDAQLKAAVAWLEGECLDAHTGGVVKRRNCPTCWAEFVAAGKEN